MSSSHLDQRWDADIVCVGLGPATAGFLTTIARRLADPSKPPIESRAIPGLPLQVICYERADDVSFGVSGLVTKARAIRKSFADLQLRQIPMAAPVSEERLVYLLDPWGASRRGWLLRLLDRTIRTFRWLLPYRDEALELPWIPAFLRKQGGWVLSLGQFMQWVAQQLMETATVQLWPASPVKEPLIENGRVTGVRLVDQGVERDGRPGPGFTPGMEVRAWLTVVGDGPIGPVGRKLDEVFGVPEGYARDEWALGMKFVIELPEGGPLQPGTVIHTLGFPEPEIFGFCYAHSRDVVSIGIFVPSWLGNPARCAYQYLQYYIQHPYFWGWLQAGRLRSWGAKSVLESGKRAEPWLVGEGFARIGEGSGTTNVLTGSGVDEAWASGVLLAEAVIELLERGQTPDASALEQTYVHKRRTSWLEREARTAVRSREGFRRGFFSGLVGMLLAGYTRGRLHVPARRGSRKVLSLEDYYAGRIASQELERIRTECARQAKPLHDALMEAAGWPAIRYDGRILLSHQDALLIGGKVQAAAGYADHVIFRDRALCDRCKVRLCIEMCSGQAILPGHDGRPTFDRDKCVHCGACVWNCPEGNVEFRAGAGGLHSAEN